MIIYIFRYNKTIVFAHCDSNGVDAFLMECLYQVVVPLHPEWGEAPSITVHTGQLVEALLVEEVSSGQ